MGILNVTPDSFSDGGEFMSTDVAIRHGLAMVADGADIIDVGPESTRPGSHPIAAAEQLRRSIPVIRALRRENCDVTISIDTRLADVAQPAIDAGADWINDTSALRDDSDMVSFAARRGATVILMHRRGAPADMQKEGGPIYNDVVREISDFLRERVAFAIENGLGPDRIVVDPGIGFGKRTEHNLTILRHVDQFGCVGPASHPELPVLIGVSRKRFIGTILGIDDPKQRDHASLACALIAAIHGASILRVHDVQSAVHALRLWREIRSAQ